MPEDLKVIFATVNEWLRYLETKHTALIALNGAAILGLIQALKDIGNVSAKNTITYVLIPGFIFSLTISLFSMTKWGKVVNGFNRKARKKNLNPLYFGFISSVNLGSYISTLTDEGYIASSDDPKEGYLISQIHTNAEIAFSKQRLFHWAVTITFSTLIIGLVLFLINRYFYPMAFLNTK